MTDDDRPLRRCLRCRRPLSDLDSVLAGLGPTCRRIVQADAAERLGADHDRFDLPFDWATMDVVLAKDADGVIHSNVPHVHHQHSNGFAWGYHGSGPADLALNILSLFLPPPLGARGEDGLRPPQFGTCLILSDATRVSWQAWDWHQEFKRVFLATLPEEGGTLPGAAIGAWIVKMAGSVVVA